jgi:hypothetical protein
VTLSDLASIGSLVSGVAVLVSLIYLAQQTRQNTRHTRALMQQGRALQAQEFMSSYATDATLTDLFVRGGDGDLTMDRNQIVRYFMTTLGLFYNFEDLFYQHRDGLIDDERHKATTSTVGINLARPGVRAVWRIGGANFGIDFQNFVNALILNTKVDANGTSLPENWKQMVEAERPAPSA